MISSFFKELFNRLNQGRWPYLIVIGHILAGSLLVYTHPRSNLAFLVLMTSFLSLYFFTTSMRFKLIAGALLALIIIPVRWGQEYLLSGGYLSDQCFCGSRPRFEYRCRFCRTA